MQDLYSLGARHFAVLSVLPLGCLPAGRQSVGGLLCADIANQAAQQFNTEYSAALTKLNGELADAKFTFIDVYSPLLNLMTNPAQSGVYMHSV